ncbi:Arylsulfatase [Pontiella desulfatans]|uniref:Arylsulfatase n=1 Tax=Pontiella desulfatans TaxID=2750659 RepID=A0A6C2TYX7_PONDE|nr:sulfatase-like hydrolase/transferase [Pontiella desulfatans]SPS73700.1 sulfatase S1_51 [Kiritimatiellales bacterium]VGO12805.1 Arylsulfatase [Pontiella desulfatans]
MKKELLFALLSVAIGAGASVQVDLSHAYVGPAAVAQNTGDLQLSFSVNATGGVALAATSADPDPAVYVAGFSAWGAVSNPALWNGSFSIHVSSVGNLRIDNGGLGLCIQGGDAQKIDWSNEVVVATIDVPDGTFGLLGVDYANASTSAGTLLDVNGTSHALSGAAGSVAVSGEGGFSISSASDGQGQGFVLAGFSFDVFPASNHSMALGTDLTDEVVVTLAGSSTNFAFPGSTGDVLTVGSAATLITIPDDGGTSPVELNGGGLALEPGSQWMLDGANYSNAFAVGERFVLANYGSFSGGTLGVGFRNFNLPADRDLALVQASTSLYFEVVSQSPATGPNIIIVNVDDMVGGQHFGFEGRDCLTPTLDSMAANGINFREAFAASTVCGPSRYSLMTGRWASRNTSENYMSKYPPGTLGRFGVSDTELEDDGENVGAWLQRAGYRTGFVGKAHLIDDELGRTNDWPSVGMIPYPQAADPATDAGVNGAMRHNHRILTQRMRPYGFDFVGGLYRANLLELRNDALNVHNQEWITKNALDFIDQNHRQRFFLYMAPTINHGPVRNDLTKSLRADPRYTGAGFLPDQDYSFMPPRQAIIAEVENAGKELISARETWIDYSLAAITNRLAAHGIENDTLIIFTADHGEKTLTNSPAIWGKSSLYDLGMRVPLVMRWPNGIAAPGRVYDESVSHIDFVPTLLELAGAAGLPTREIDGESLVPVLDGSTAALRSEVFCEIGYARAVRSREWKYIAVRYTPSVYAQIESGYLWKNYITGLFTEPRPYYVNNSGLGYYTQNTHPGYFDDDQLYDLANDPMEQTNLYGKLPAITYDLKKRLAVYMGDIPNRPFRQSSDSSVEFSPSPPGMPEAPDAIQVQCLDSNRIRLGWNDVSASELGYIVEQSTHGAGFGMVAELPAGSTSATVFVSADIEDAMLRVSAYNALGDSAASSDVDLLAPDCWRHRTFGSTTSSNSQWTADPDGDGLETIWEYAFATDPLNPASSASMGGGVSNQWLQLVVPRNQRRMVAIQARVSTNLHDWAVGEPAATVVASSESNLVFQSSTPVGGASSQFIGADITIP